MSRVGKTPIRIPAGVTVRDDDRVVMIEGQKGSGRHALPPKISVAVSNGMLTVTREDDARKTRALHGLTRKLLANIVAGVSTGFARTLEIIGIGYRAEVKGNTVLLSLGYSHPIVYQLPPGVEARVDRQTVLTLEASDLQLLGEVSAQIRALRPPEPYKGKGIKYSHERIRRKAGKAAVSGR